MLRALPRIVVAFALVASAGAAPADALVGWWRNDNEERFAEMQLRRDGQFASLSRNNAVLAVVPLHEQSGTWQLRGMRLIIDATTRHTDKQTRKQLRIVSVSPRSLRVRTADGHTDTYRRLPDPFCAPPPSPHHRRVLRDAVIGRWRGHYRTHEIEINVEGAGRGTIRTWDVGSRPSSYNYRWRLANNTLVMNPREGDGKIRWFLDSATGDCISFRDGSGMLYTLQRVR